MTRAKICGITRHEDAEHAVELGAWAIGLIRWPARRAPATPTPPRRSWPSCAGAWPASGCSSTPTLEELAREAEQVPYSHLQLHGDEGPAFCSEAARRTGCKIIKAARVAGPGDIRDLERFHTDFHLLDAAAAGFRGGSGHAGSGACSPTAARRRP